MIFSKNIESLMNFFIFILHRNLLEQNYMTNENKMFLFCYLYDEISS